jgi:two-component system response regulator HydG
MITEPEQTNEIKTILVVDDEPENRRIYSEILSDLGYKVIDEPDGASALSDIRQGGKIDLVITDYKMPGMNGLELAATLRNILPSIPVLMLTAYASIENYLQSLSLGVFEYINKPVGRMELIRIVRMALNDHSAC